MGAITNKELAPGIRFLGVKHQALKTNRVTVSIRVPLCEKTAAENALVMEVLKSCSQQYPDYTSLKQYLAMLYGASISSGAIKSGDCQLLTLSISAVDNRFALEDEDVLLECTKLLISLLLHPLFDQKEIFDSNIIAIRKRILCEKILAEINNKRSYARSRAAQIMSGDGAYGVNPIGTVEKAQAITPEGATGAWKRLLEQGEIVFSVVGASDSCASLELFDNAAKSIKRNFTPVCTTELFVSNKKQKVITERMEIMQSKLVMGFETGDNLTVSSCAALRLMTALFGGTPHSLLFLNVRERLSLCYYCAAQVDTVKGVLTVDCGLEEENVQAAKSEILHQLERIKNGDFSDEELSCAKLSISNSFRSVGDSAVSLEAYYLLRLWNNHLLSPQTAAEQLERISREQVIEAAHKIVLDTCYLLAGEGNANEQ